VGLNIIRKQLNIPVYSYKKETYVHPR